MNLTFAQDYWHDSSLKAEFVNFLIDIFGLDLSTWDRLGYWDNNFRPFSYFDGSTLVSSVCVYSLDMTVVGKRCRVAQISSVGTRPEYRRRGLSRQLIERAIEWAQDSHDFFFLFADAEAIPLYRKCGFRPAMEHKATITVSPVANRSGARKLDLDSPDDRELVYRLAERRQPVSDLLGLHNEKLFMYWCLYYLKDNTYFISDLDLLVLFKRDGALLTVYDIVSASVPSFSEVYPYICSESDRQVEFRFMTDKLRIETPATFTPVESNETHLLGNFPLEHTNFLFPCTSQA